MILAALLTLHANHAACFAVSSSSSSINRLGQDVVSKRKGKAFRVQSPLQVATSPGLLVDRDPMASAIRRAKSRLVVPSNVTTIAGGAQEALLPNQADTIATLKDVSPVQSPPASDATTATTTSTANVPLSSIDVGAFFIHFCAIITMTLPVMIVPMMDAELAVRNIAAVRGASLAALMASTAPMGNGIGKLLNGMVCQEMGGPRSSRVYFTGSILASLALACISLAPTSSGLLTTSNLGWMVGGIEFFASIQWTVCSLFLSQYYRQSPALFARGVTILALSSTVGQIVAKVAAAGLLQFMHWRHVARMGVMVAMAGLATSLWTSRNMRKALGSKMNVAEEENNTKTSPQGDQTKMMGKKVHDKQPAAAKTSARQAAMKVLSNPIFWSIGLAHISGYLTRTSDRVLGVFLQDITSLSPQICGGLTAFMTVGFLHGLVTTSRKFNQQSVTRERKLSLISNGYKRYLFAALGLVASAAFGKQWHPYASASVITLCASIMASSIAFPYFQVPNMVSSVFFAPVKPVALSLIDGTGIFMTSPLWKVFNKVLLPNFGWTGAWSAVAVTVGLCGMLLMKTMPTVLDMQQKQQEEDSAP
ncbi:expressed unknown protein [Seminavis robusta]|uniref:Uncharacterized protein n=1 Tax=Seminavis robusta TaxID=568900 RepID=A0A9N8HHC6_9STRA|nr:expressed unknown protein [Seminavis robusta]|eukprot:Sro441_g143730.1 n/a (592) ;mRNA; f:47720-49586